MARRRPAPVLVADGLSLVLPTECAGCGRPDRSLCRRCRRAFGAPVRCEELTAHLSLPAAHLPVWTTAVYDAEVRHAVLAWKSGGRPDLFQPLTSTMRMAARTVAGELAAGGRARRVAVVPAPSGGARRRSGRFVVGDLADAVGAGVAEAADIPVDVVDVLRRRRSAGHLMSAADRGRDRADAVRCLAPLTGTVCLLVDDVVTTGATLAGCARALGSAGAQVSGALTLAATMPPGAAPTSSGWTP